MKQSGALPFRLLLFAILHTVAFGTTILNAQNTWERDIQQVLDIPSVATMEGSSTHLYVLSCQDGLVVFRAYADSLQWLYSSEGMQERGDILQADARFAYLYGDSRRLTVVEPTSVLGVYSSTELPDRPRSVQRLEDRIYIALGEWGLGELSLESPDQLDSEPTRRLGQELNDLSVQDLVSDQNSRLYILAGNRRLLITEPGDNDTPLEIVRNVELTEPIDRIFLANQELVGGNQDGELFLIDSSGRTRAISTLDSSAMKVLGWEDQWVVRTKSGELWIGESEPTVWKEDTDAGNLIAVAGQKLWISEFNRIAPVIPAVDRGEHASADTPPELKPIENLTIPYPRPVLIPLELTSDHDPTKIEFAFQSQVENARIRGQSLYWQPSSGQTGRFQFTITASTPAGLSDSREFTIEVRPYNTPPRFTPLQPVSINIEEPFSFDITAFDPDGFNSELIRYIGVDLPEGSSLNEQTGEFQWTPSIRQIGEHKFQVIATDQFGAASSANMTIQVIETDPEEEADIPLGNEE